MIDIKPIREIGLSDNEAEVYITLLTLRETTASQIAKQTKIARTNIYDELNKLIEKGFVSYVIKNNVKYFKPINPNKIINYLKEKEWGIKSILPALNELYKPIKEKANIEIYEGKEGLKIVLNDIIRTKKEVYSFGASDKVKEYLPKFFIESYIREREKNKIIAKQLFSEGTGVIRTPVSVFRKLPKEFTSPSTTVIYGNKVTIWIWEEIPKIIMIESKATSQSYKAHFNLMWKLAKK
jgi:sugar-specific transcriptional regulator TrmB